MSGRSIFTHRKFGLERNVWVLMLLVCIGCIGLLGYKIATNKPCIPIRLEVKNTAGNSGVFYVNTTLRFAAYSDTSKQVNWNFDDKLNVNETGNLVFHSFSNPGEYTVKADIDGRCEELLVVKVVANPKTDYDPAQFANVIVLIDSASQRVGERVSLTSSADAKQYEWSIDGSSEAPKTGKFVTFVFDQPQSYTVKLVLDKDPKKTYSMPLMINPPRQSTLPKPTANVPRILVPDNYPPPYTPPPVVNNPVPAVDSKPAEVKPAPDVKKADPVPDGPVQPPRVYYFKNTDQFKGMLEEVVSGDKNVKDFDKYLCDGANTPVTENGAQITFIQLCRNLANSKIKITAVAFLDVTTFADKSRCVKELKVTYEKPKSGWFHKN